MRRVKRLDEGLRLRIESEDDLWVLSQVCGTGCLVGMLSHRRDSTTGTREDGRAKSAERKPMWILLEAVETSFQPFTDSLRVHGIIKEAKIDIGSHHTHVISPGDEVELTREGGLSKSDASLLKETIASTNAEAQARYTAAFPDRPVPSNPAAALRAAQTGQAHLPKADFQQTSAALYGAVADLPGTHLVSLRYDRGLGELRATLTYPSFGADLDLKQSVEATGLKVNLGDTRLEEGRVVGDLAIGGTS